MVSTHSAQFGAQMPTRSPPLRPHATKPGDPFDLAVHFREAEPQRLMRHRQRQCVRRVRRAAASTPSTVRYRSAAARADTKLSACPDFDSVMAAPSRIAARRLEVVAGVDSNMRGTPRCR